VQAGVDSNDTLLLKDVWRAWTPELAGLFGTWRTASSRSFSRCMTLRMTEHEEICPGSFMFIYQFMKT
jgi:hypothetical protein